MSNALEDLLGNKYLQPHVLPVPDELDPEIPRLVFGSKHGFSRIIVSQVSCKLAVVYSKDWQEEIEKPREYLLERVSLLFEILKVTKIDSAFFCGLNSQINISTDQNDDHILSHISSLYLKDYNPQNTHDLEIKSTAIIDDRFFSNITIKNFRKWTLAVSSNEVLGLSRDSATERGISIIGDFNDRYLFNEREKYHTNQETVSNIINLGIDELNKIIHKIGVKS